MVPEGIMVPGQGGVYMQARNSVQNSFLRQSTPPLNQPVQMNPV